MFVSAQRRFSGSSGGQSREGGTMTESLTCDNESNVPPIQDSYIVEDSDIVLDSYNHSQSEAGQLLHVVTAAC